MLLLFFRLIASKTVDDARWYFYSFLLPSAVAVIWMVLVVALGAIEAAWSRRCRRRWRWELIQLLERDAATLSDLRTEFKRCLRARLGAESDPFAQRLLDLHDADPAVELFAIARRFKT